MTTAAADAILLPSLASVLLPVSPQSRHSLSTQGSRNVLADLDAAASIVGVPFDFGSAKRRTGNHSRLDPTATESIPTQRCSIRPRCLTFDLDHHICINPVAATSRPELTPARPA